jgi:hypothetical protein
MDRLVVRIDKIWLGSCLVNPEFGYLEGSRVALFPLCGRISQ